jgi:hypothetical protein
VEAGKVLACLGWPAVGYGRILADAPRRHFWSPARAGGLRALLEVLDHHPSGFCLAGAVLAKLEEANVKQPAFPVGLAGDGNEVMLFKARLDTGVATGSAAPCAPGPALRFPLRDPQRKPLPHPYQR